MKNKWKGLGFIFLSFSFFRFFPFRLLVLPWASCPNVGQEWGAKHSTLPEMNGLSCKKHFFQTFKFRSKSFFEHQKITGRTSRSLQFNYKRILKILKTIKFWKLSDHGKKTFFFKLSNFARIHFWNIKKWPEEHREA